MKIVFKIILFFTIIVFIITCGIYVRFDAENTEKIFEDRLF